MRNLLSVLLTKYYIRVNKSRKMNWQGMEDVLGREEVHTAFW